MRAERLQSILAFLALLGVVRGGTANALPECGAKAWVRAPDLSPNTIVQGDVRVKISVGCPAVETVSLGLRFKERSFMRALRSREDAKRLHPGHSAPLGIESTSPWQFTPLPFGDEATQERLLLLSNKDLWIVREEERVAFETTQNIHVGTRRRAGHDITEDFSILVPSTNFPPALNYGNAGFGAGAELADVDSRYEYFVQVSFANGTTEEIPAGLTAFQPQYNEADYPMKHNSGSEIIELKRGSVLPGSFETSKNPTAVTYTAEISATSGMVFSEGSKDQTITVAITRTGPAHAFVRPLTVWACVEPTFSSRWAVEHGMADSQPVQRPRQVLRSTREDLKQAHDHSWLSCGGPPRPGVSVMMPNSTLDEIQANEIVTTSTTVTISVKVGRRLVPNFETYYQTIASALVVNLQMEDDHVNQHVPSPESMFNSGQWFEDGEEEWAPWERRRKFAPQPSPWVPYMYSGRIPVVVRPVGDVQLPPRCLEADTDVSGQVVMSDDTGCKQPSLLHYLSDGARAPTFVDGNVVRELRAKDPAERALLAPLLEPVISSPPAGEELVYRSHTAPQPGRPPVIYVGETWAKKVAYKDWRIPITGGNYQTPEHN